MKIEQPFLRIKQNKPAPELSGPMDEALVQSLARVGWPEIDLTGLTVGLTAGSRGIDRLPEILAAVVRQVKTKGGRPVIIPAMGTHGGDTAQRQIDLLASLGVTEGAVGCPINSQVETELLGTTREGVPVYASRAALEVDRLLIINRVKPHTDFSGDIESGLAKMMTIGLGAHRGAEAAHLYARQLGHELVFTSVAEVLRNKLPVLLGLGIYENWKGRLAGLEAFRPEDMPDGEKRLLAKVKEMTIKLPFEDLDVLVVGETGKNISGTGMDTKVVGRIMVKGQKEPEKPRIGCLAVLNLTEESHGNGCGLGLAEITTQKVLDRVDFLTTADNCISSMAPEQGRLPCVVPNDYRAITAAIATLGPVPVEQVRIAYIRNTLRLETLAVGQALRPMIERNPGLSIIGPPEYLQFDEHGELLSFRDF
ncbi:nickel-dependent lactate racemase [Deltaproteobacteria bacterium OttesenSCG-928-M10]|nr:nickel-dependent lactate racemase [Deltaproteobacteria bacterium OttesenSCG-928-M10]